MSNSQNAQDGPQDVGEEAANRIEAHKAALSGGPFLNNMSHEINTPMNGVISMIDLLLESGLTSTQQEMASIALASAENLQALLNNILDFSKIETTTLALRAAPFDLLSQVEILTNIHTAAANKKGLRLIVNYPAAARRLMIGDANRIRQVMANLLSNAIKFTATGQVVLDVRVNETAENRCRLRISVSDSGIGIPPAILDDIFHKIIPGDASTTRQYSGAGLGLVICKRLVDLMGGDIGVDTDAGQGSTFWFELELPLTLNALGGVRVMFVDPDEASRRATETHFSQQGMRGEGYATSNAALVALEKAVAAQDPYRIAVFDQQMPGIDGETLGLALKLDPIYNSILLVLLSTVSRSSDVQRFAQAGFSALLRKPVPPQLLLDTLSTLADSIKTGKPCPFISHANNNDQTALYAHSRVLVVDDNVVNQMVAIRMLEKLGCHTDAASNGEIAIAMLATDKYDLVLMDCQMPKLDGYQTTARIRAGEAAGSHTPIIGWTAYAIEGGQDKCISAGMDDYLCKPIRPQVLRDMLDRWLRQAAPPRPTPGVEEPGDELDAMQEMFGADFVELAALFRTDSPERINAMYQATADNDCNKLTKIAHALSGSSASIGATAMSVLCKELEMRSKPGMPPDAMARLTAIELEYTKIDGRLRAMVQSTSA